MKKPFVIGITGGSGSGKTSFILALKEKFTAEQICFISQDDYYKTKDKQTKDDQGIENFDKPRSIYRQEFIEDLKKLMDGEDIERPEYTFNNKNAKPKMQVFKAAPIIIVEGLFIFHLKKVRKCIDLKIFIEAEDTLKVVRRINRDQIERNYPLDDVLYRYANHVMPAYEKYIEPYKAKADIVVNNNKNFDQGLAVVLAFLRAKLKA